MKKLVITVCAVVAMLANLNGAEKLSLSNDGIAIENGASKLNLSYPLLVNAAKKKIKISDKSVTGNKAVLKYDGGGKIDLELGDGEISMKLSELPNDIKLIYYTIILNMDYKNGGKWIIGNGDAKAFPKDKPSKPFLFQGGATKLCLINPAGIKTTFQVPDYTYHQLQDNREWGGNIFQWQCWIPYNPNAEKITMKIGESGASSPTEKTVIAPTPVKKEVLMADAGILKWKDGKRAVFMLEFDDSCVTHVTNAIPELKKRGLVGTFYINPGNGPFKNKQKDWETKIPKMGMEYGNHTFTHKGAPDLATVDKDIAQCSELINKCFPDRKQPRLISFGQPGGVPWKISNEEKKKLLAKYNLIDRPPFFGYPFHAKTKEDVLNLVDKAIAKGDMGHHDFHGVGGDWLITPMDIFIALLDKLEANKEIVWVTDPVSYHKYLTERKGAEVKIVKKDKDQIKVKLTCKTDPALYDLPLTLYTKVPAGWKKCSVEQNKSKNKIQVADGAIRYSAIPETSEIIIRKVQ